MEAEMKFHACIARPMSFQGLSKLYLESPWSFDWHGSISPESGLAFLRA